LRIGYSLNQRERERERERDLPRRDTEVDDGITAKKTKKGSTHCESWRLRRRKTLPALLFTSQVVMKQ